MTDERARGLARRAAGLAAGAGVELPASLLLWQLAGGRPAAAVAVSSPDPAAELGAALEAGLTAAERRRGAHYTPADLARQVAGLALGGSSPPGSEPDLQPVVVGHAEADQEPQVAGSGAPHRGLVVARAPQAHRGPQVAGGGAPHRGPVVASQPEADQEPRVGGAAAVVDPTCGGGALLLAAGDVLVDAGIPADVVARDLLWGGDVDPLAAAVTEAAIALWSGGTPPAPGHVVVADTLLAGAAAWPDRPPGGFAAVVGNPPFQGQLARATARTRDEASALAARFGTSLPPYVDTAALFLLAATELVRPGGRVAMIVPQSLAAARDAGPVRAELAGRGVLEQLVVPADRPFGARVHVCVPVLRVGDRRGSDDWTAHLAAASGVPDVGPDVGHGRLGDIADVVASFRHEYYALAGHVREACTGDDTGAPLVTSGLLGVGTMAWGRRPVRFAKRIWERPVVDVTAAAAADSRVAGWLGRVGRPKAVVASQTRVVEAAADPGGRWIPSTPALAVVPHDQGAVERVTALLCAPPVAAWAARQAAGTALSPGALRISAGLLADVPLPADGALWEQAGTHLAMGDLDAYARAATAMFALPRSDANAVRQWWLARRPMS